MQVVNHVMVCLHRHNVANKDISYIALVKEALVCKVASKEQSVSSYEIDIPLLLSPFKTFPLTSLLCILKPQYTLSVERNG